MRINREVHLVKRPDGAPVESDFRLVERPIGEPADGEVLVRNLYLSLDPAFRPALTAAQPLGAPVFGLGLGRVAASRARGLGEGDLVWGRVGLQEYWLGESTGLQKIEPDPELPLSAYAGVMGPTGMTAVVGVEEVAKPQAGEVMFISTAAGAVGSVAAQLARRRGAVVIGSTGSAEKARWLKEDLKLDHVINYRETSLVEALRAAAPDGIDLYFDNVGGDHLDAALEVIKPRGRIVVCGMIAAYNDANSKSVVRNMFQVIAKRLTITGFSMQDWGGYRSRFEPQMSAWLKAGQIRYRETILEGIEQAPAGFAGIMRGDNIGKMLVKLA